MKNFLYFRTMITPIIVQVLFWMVALICIVVGAFDFFHGKYRYGIEVIIFGPLIARIGAELIMLFFQMNESLGQIRDRLKEQK